MARDHGWDWSKFKGSAKGLEYCKRDLENVDAFLALFPNRRGVAVQAGGNLGIFPKRLAQEFETVYAIEPDPENFRAMCCNVPELNVIKLQMAVSDEREPVHIVRARRDGKEETHEGTRFVAELPVMPDCDDPDEPGLLDPYEGDPIVPAIRIDDLRLKSCDLIYLDVEGWEPRALGGALETIARHRPAIALEVNKQLALAGFNEERVVAMVEGFGYCQAAVSHSDRLFLHQDSIP